METHSAQRLRLTSSLLLAVTLLLVSLVYARPHPNDRVVVTVYEGQRRVDISIYGQPFTS